MNAQSNFVGNLWDKVTRSPHVEFPARVIKRIGFLLLFTVLELAFIGTLILGIVFLLRGENYSLGGWLIGFGLFFSWGVPVFVVSQLKSKRIKPE